MYVVALQVLGIAVFVGVTCVERHALDRSPTAETAVRTSRWGHAAFYGGVVLPFAAGLVAAALGMLDGVLHVPPLPLSAPLRVGIALVLLVPSAYFSMASNRGLAMRGRGAAAFKLTTSVVTDQAYGMTRNPMSVGFYLGCIAMSLLLDSSYLLLYSILLVIPAHVFFLKFFEEHELAVRYGESYDAYRARTPFLIPRIHPARH